MFQILLSIAMKTKITLQSGYTAVLLISALLFGSPGFAHAKFAGAISGTVIDKDKKAMDYATVSLLLAKDSSLVKGTLTDENGKFEISPLANGKYILSATMVGYKKVYSKAFIVDETLNDLVLEPLQLTPVSQQLNEVSVLSQKPLIEHKIDKTVLNVENSTLAAGNSALEILEKAPGITVDKDDKISLRGKQGVTVMIDGKPTYLSQTELANLLRSTEGNAIQSIEIISNPSAKYDAAGNSGIINIKLKKNRANGTNGNLTLGTGYGTFYKANAGITLNHRKNKVNFFGNYNYSNNKSANNLNIDRISNLENPTYFNQLSEFEWVNKNNNFKTGIDYFISEKNTLGLMVTGYLNGGNETNHNNTVIGRTQHQTDSSLLVLSDNVRKFNSLSYSINYKSTIDTLGKELTMDLDYSRFSGNQKFDYDNYFYTPTGQDRKPAVFYKNAMPSVIDIQSVKADYTHPFSKSLKMEAGLKSSWVKTDNDFQFKIKENASWANDPLRSNQFIYNENINAAYLNISKEFKTTHIQLGLRAEQTNSKGDLITNNQMVKRHYLNLFPSVFIKQPLSANHELGFSYSRRIDRPSYEDLNPFVYFLDEYTYNKGNAFLNPQYTNSYEIVYIYKKVYTATVNYSRTNDVITEVLLPDTAKKALYQTNENLARQASYSLNLDAPVKFVKWWNVNNNLNVFYLGFRTPNLLGKEFKSGKVAFQFNSNHNFMINKTLGAELTGKYESPLVYGTYNILKPRYSVDFGVNKSFADKKANLKLAVSDIFNTRSQHISSLIPGVNYRIDQKHESRVFRLTFTYRLGSNDITPSRRNTGAEDEKSRIKSGN